MECTNMSKRKVTNHMTNDVIKTTAERSGVRSRTDHVLENQVPSNHKGSELANGDVTI